MALSCSLQALAHFMIFSPTYLLPRLPQDYSGTWWVALSGGLDSCVLLHALVALQLPVNLRALHVNHQISPNAMAWQQHCADLCERLNIPFSAVSVVVENSGRGIEDAARSARYQVFEQHLAQHDYLLTAHHADDQAETILLRLMRGTGPRGLAAMAQQRPLAAGILYRPLLSFTRSELEHYAQTHGISWVDDESNTNDGYDRNYLRNQVMPLLRERWPSFTHKWQQTADLCVLNEKLLDELVDEDLRQAGFKSELVGSSISLGYLEGLSAARRNNLIRGWLRGQGLSTPEQQHLDQIDQQIIAGRPDAEAQVTWGDVSVRVYRQRVYALPLVDLPSVPENPPAFATPLDLPSGFRLQFELCSASAKPILKPGLPDLSVRFRSGGERCKPVGRAHSQTLKRLLQDYGVAPWLRESLPLIYSGEELIAVADLWVCEGYQADAEGYCLKYERITKSHAS
jgi:tRNA(Ile)-lysidine synthase